MKAVNEVWESCFPDTRPFDEVGANSTTAMNAHSPAGLLIAFAEVFHRQPGHRNPRYSE